MKWLEFNDCLFETTGLYVGKFDSLSKDGDKDSFYISVRNCSMGTQKKYYTQKERDESYSQILIDMNPHELILFIK